MSGIFGIYHSDNRPINPSHLQGMAKSSAHRGPDGTNTLIQEHIGFGHSMLHTTPESLTEILPHTDSETGLVITADARIDNRGELFNKLGIRQSSSLPDSQLIIYTYKKWGVDGFLHLLGDFAFALWDPLKQQLICVRDYIGVKPFYYHFTPDQFLFSSEIKQLAEHPDVILSPNEGMVAEYLFFSFCSKTETLFQGINRLSPGHYLTISHQGLTSHRYWSFNSTKQIYYKKSEDYTNHFLEIFNKSVTSRLRSSTPISIELSGGLDSSCVVGMAHNILRLKNKQAPVVYGMVFPGLPFDESLYILAVSKEHNISVNLIDSQHFNEPQWQKQVHKTYEPPDIPNISMRNALIKQVTNSGSRILLSGIGGDEWFSGSGFPYLDLLNNKRYPALFSHLRYSFSQNQLHTIKRFLFNILWPLVPHAIRRNLCIKNNNLFPAWISPDFVNRSNIREKILLSDQRTTSSNLGNLLQNTIIAMGTHTFFLETMDRYHAIAKLEYRSPFLDRRIAEFSFSVPEYEHNLQGEIKKILRQKQNHLLPELIRKRQSKADFSFFFGKAFDSYSLTEKSEKMLSSEVGWIEQDKFLSALNDKQKAFKENAFHRGNKNWEIWFALALETWVKSTR